MQNLEKFKGINSQELRGFLTGLILGDGTIDKGIHKRSFRIKSIDKDFIDMISYVLSNNTNFKFYIKEHDAEVRNGVSHKKYWELKITAHPYFNKKYHNFYNDNRHRKIYSETLDWLNPIGLACWYMSDGYVCHVGKKSGRIYSRRIEIATDRYYPEDIQLMIKKLKEKFGIESSMITRGLTFRIRIKTESYETFINLISPYMVSSMLYKLYLGYFKKPNTLSEKAWKYQQYLLSAITLTDNAEG